MTDTTTTISIDDLPFFDLSSPEFIADSYRLLSEMRERTWIARTEIGVMIFSYDDVADLLVNPQFRQPGIVTFEIQGITSGPAYDFWNNAVLHLDGEQHTRIRRTVSGPFSAKNIDRYRPLMQQRVRELAETLPEGEPFDFVDLFADKLPMSVVGTLIGAPVEDHQLLASWTDSLGMIGPANLQQNLGHIDAAAAAMETYCRGLMAARAQCEDLGTDLLGKLLAIQRDSGGISDDEMTNLVMIMLFGGQDTTRYQLGHTMAFFLTRPDLWAELPNSTDKVVEHAASEVMRYVPAVPENFRYALEDVVIKNVAIPRGTYVSVSAAAANRDARCVLDGEQFQLDRPAAPKHLTFGKGPHFCIGQALARSEIEEVLRVLPALFPDIRPEGEIEWHIPRAITGPRRIPMSVRRSR